MHNLVYKRKTVSLCRRLLARLRHFGPDMLTTRSLDVLLTLLRAMAWLRTIPFAVRPGPRRLEPLHGLRLLPHALLVAAMALYFAFLLAQWPLTARRTPLQFQFLHLQWVLSYWVPLLCALASLRQREDVASAINHFLQISDERQFRAATPKGGLRRDTAALLLHASRLSALTHSTLMTNFFLENHLQPWYFLSLLPIQASLSPPVLLLFALWEFACNLMAFAFLLLPLLAVMSHWHGATTALACLR